MGEKSVCVNKAANELHLSVLYCIDAALWVSVFMEEVLKHKGSVPSLWTFFFNNLSLVKRFSAWIVLGVQLCFIPFLSMYLWHTKLECLHRWERATRFEWEIESCHPTFVLPIPVDWACRSSVLVQDQADAFVMCNLLCMGGSLFRYRRLLGISLSPV